MKRRLKVFQAQFGFFDTVVAAASQAAALRIWDTRQNLFDSGDASVCTDEAAIQAALAHPETLLRRAVGSRDPFKLAQARLPDVPDKPDAPAKRAVKVKPPRPPPDRTHLTTAENTLMALDAAWNADEAAFKREAEAVQAQQTAAEKKYGAQRKAAMAAIASSRKAYRQAGGRS